MRTLASLIVRHPAVRRGFDPTRFVLVPHETTDTASLERPTGSMKTAFGADVQASPTYCSHLLSVDTERVLRDVLEIDEE